MTALLSAGGRAQIRSFLAALIVFLFALWKAPHTSTAVALGIAILIGVFAFSLRALQAWEPNLSITKWLGHPFGDWADAFVQGFVSAIIVTVPALLSQLDGLHTDRAVLLSLLVGALAAGMRAVQGLLTVGEQPAPGLGIAEPKMPYSYAAPSP